MSLINIKAIKAAEAAHKRLFEKARKAVNELPVPGATKAEVIKIIDEKYGSSLHEILQAGLLPPAPVKVIDATPIPWPIPESPDFEKIITPEAEQNPPLVDQQNLF